MGAREEFTGCLVLPGHSHDTITFIHTELCMETGVRNIFVHANGLDTRPRSCGIIRS